MASPFSFFRRNQQSMMVALVILAMLAFTLDQVFYSRENQFVLLGVLLGGGIFAMAGIGSGQWLRYGIGGAVLGGLCGWIMPGWILSPADQETAISSDIGIFDEKRMYELQLQRGMADQFMRRATEAAFGEGTAQFANVFGFGHQSPREDVVFGELMRHEASTMGIVVTDLMVTSYINHATGDKLSRQAFAQVRSQLLQEGQKISDEQLYDILRKEIQARMAYQMLRPQPTALPPTPETWYNVFRRLNVSQRLSTARVDVDAFLSGIPEPSETEVSELFASARTKRPNEDAPGSPGFRQPRKTRLACIEVDYQAMETEASAVTDAEVESWYNENRETRYRRPVAPSPPAAPSGTVPPTTPEKPEAGTPEPVTPEPVTPEPVKPEPVTPEPAAPEPAAPQPDAPAPSGSDSSASAEGDCGSEADDSDVSSEAAVSDKSVAGEAAPAVTGEAPIAPTATEEPSAAAPATPASPLTIPAADTSGSAEQQFPEQKYEYRPLDDELKAEIREQLLGQRVRESIDSKVSGIFAEMKKLESDRRSYRRKLNEELNSIDSEKLAAPLKEYSAGIGPQAKKVADNARCAYVETPLVSFEDLLNRENYPIGSATPPGGSPFAPAGMDVARTVFSVPGDDLQFFIPRRASLPGRNLDSGETHYVWWITDDAEAHVPVLDEPGIREQVVLTAKRQKARELAKKRAEELAQVVREGLQKPEDQKQPMAASLVDLTISGAQDTAKLVVRQTLLFSWMRQQLTPQMNFLQQQPQAELSEIQFADDSGDTLEYAYDDFMRVVFDDLQNGEVGVAPNADLSSFYVVQVLDRTPAGESGEETLLQRFLAEGRRDAFGRSAVTQIVQQSVAGTVALEWEKNIRRKRGIDPDAAPQE